MVKSVKFNTPVELASFSPGKSAVVFVVGDFLKCQAKVEELETIALETEAIVHVDPSDRIFELMDRPKSYPAVGFWSSKGALIGYQEQSETLQEFLESARRYC